MMLQSDRMREASLYLNNFPRDFDWNQRRHVIFYLPTRQFEFPVRNVPVLHETDIKSLRVQISLRDTNDR